MILVTGAAGQLGSGLVRFLQRNNIDAVGVDHADFDIIDQEATVNYITALKPECVFHCAAYSNVEKAEQEQQLCTQTNIDGTRNIIMACTKLSAKLVYISTDYVFDGTSAVPYQTTDAVHPLSVYGETKAAGEELVKKYDKSFIVRISWLFGKNGNNFVNTMLALGSRKKMLKVVADQFGSPTYVEDLVPLLYAICKTEKYGIYHITNEDDCSWAEFAKQIMKYSNLDCEIKPVTSEEYGAAAQRPKNSRLSKVCLDEQGFWHLPNWKDALQRYLSDCIKR